MYIQANVQANLPRTPYATLALMTRQGAMGEERGPLARKPMPGVAHAAPVLRSQLLARVERYEGLHQQIVALRSALSQVTPLLKTGSSNSPSFESLGLTERTASVPAAGPTSGAPATQARLVTEAVSLNPTALTTSTHAGGKIQLNNQGETTDFGAVTLNGIEGAIVSDTDGDSSNDRALGFVVGGQATRRETTEAVGGSSGGQSGSTGSGSPVSGDGSDLDGQGGRGRGTGAGDESDGGLAAGRAALHEQVREWMRLTNGYLVALDERSHERPQGDLQAFGRTIGAMLRDPGLSSAGLKVENGRLSLDEETFIRSLERDPQAALGAMQQFRETLDPLLAAQAHAMAFMREVADATRDRAPEISQAVTVRYRLEQRSKEAATWLESLEKLLPDLSEQKERLDRLDADKKEASETEPDDSPEAAGPRTSERFSWLAEPRPTPFGGWKTKEDRP